MTTKVDRRLTPLVEGEHADLAARLNGMVTAGDLVILFQPNSPRTEFAFQAIATPSGKHGILAIARVQ